MEHNLSSNLTVGEIINKIEDLSKIGRYDDHDRWIALLHFLEVKGVMPQ